MTVREEQQIGIRWLTEVVWRVWKVLQLPPRLPPECGRVAAHEERAEVLRRPRQVEQVARVHATENLWGSSSLPLNCDTTEAA